MKAIQLVYSLILFSPVLFSSSVTAQDLHEGEFEESERSPAGGSPVEGTSGPDEFGEDGGSETCDLLEATGTDEDDYLAFFDLFQSDEEAGNFATAGGGGGLLKRFCPWLKPKKRISPSIIRRCKINDGHCRNCVDAKVNKQFNDCMIAQCKNPKNEYDSGPPFFQKTNNPTWYCKSSSGGSYHICSGQYQRCINDKSGRLSKRKVKKCKVPKLLTWAQACGLKSSNAPVESTIE